MSRHSLEGLAAKAKQNLSPHEMRLSPAGHQLSISWSREKLIIVVVFVFVIIIIVVIIIIIIIIINKYLYKANSLVVILYTELYAIYTLLSRRPCKT